MSKTLETLLAELRAHNALHDDRIEAALRRADRIDFVNETYREQAYEDVAMPIASGQTISQPSTVAFMLDLLEIEPGQVILDIGAGSGWTAALMSLLTGPAGKVYAVELDPEVGAIGEDNIRRFNADNIEYIIGDATEYWGQYAPYDRIHAAAAFDNIPADLLDQLRIGGIFVGPTQSSYIEKIHRKNANAFHTDSYYGYAFVPYISPHTAD